MKSIIIIIIIIIILLETITPSSSTNLQPIYNISLASFPSRESSHFPSLAFFTLSLARMVAITCECEKSSRFMPAPARPLILSLGAPALEKRRIKKAKPNEDDASEDPKKRVVTVINNLQ